MRRRIGRRRPRERATVKILYVPPVIALPIGSLGGGRVQRRAVDPAHSFSVPTHKLSTRATAWW